VSKEFSISGSMRYLLRMINYNWKKEEVLKDLSEKPDILDLQSELKKTTDFCGLNGINLLLKLKSLFSYNFLVIRTKSCIFLQLVSLFQ